jgi:hypothetical protein
MAGKVIMPQMVHVDLVKLLRQVISQVIGGDERAILESWLARNTGEQIVTIDLYACEPDDPESME